MSKQNRWLLISVAVIVLLGGALLWQHFHEQIISVLGGGVAAIPPVRHGDAATTAPASAAAPPLASPPIAPSEGTAPAQAVRLHFAAGRIQSCSHHVLVLAGGEQARLSFEISDENEAECVRNIGRVVRVAYTETDGRKIASRIAPSAQQQQKAASR